MKVNNGPCISCGEFTENTEHGCTDCTAGARARLRVKGLSNDELMAKNVGGRPSGTSTRVEVSNVALAAELGVSDETVRRAKRVELASRDLIALDEIPEAKPHLEQGTGNNERYTPAYILEAVRHVTGPIILDPASSVEANETVQAQRIFTLEDDVLVQDWEADSLWFNPPYARGDIEAFVEKLVSELNNIGLVLGITHNATETGWCQTLLARSAAICLLNSRVHFPAPVGGGNSGALRGQVIFLLGKHSRASIPVFTESFKQLGVVYVPHCAGNPCR